LKKRYFAFIVFGVGGIGFQEEENQKLVLNVIPSIGINIRKKN
jgi:hypothetical protein